MLPYQECKKLVKSLNIKNPRDLKKNAKIYKDIPFYPAKVYSEEFEGLHEFLGLDVKVLSFKEANEKIKQYDICSTAMYKVFIYKGEGLQLGFPVKPEKEYGSEWVSYPDFLGQFEGYAKKKRKYLSKEEAIEYLKSINITTNVDWYNYRDNNEIPSFLPRDVVAYYKSTSRVFFQEPIYLHNKKTIETFYKKLKKWKT